MTVMINFTFDQNYLVQEQISAYCTNININILFVIAIILLMWLFENKFIEATNKMKHDSFWIEYLFGPENLQFIYRWIGLGLLFMVGYFIWIMRGGF